MGWRESRVQWRERRVRWREEKVEQREGRLIDRVREGEEAEAEREDSER